MTSSHDGWYNARFGFSAARAATGHYLGFASRAQLVGEPLFPLPHLSVAGRTISPWLTRAVYTLFAVDLARSGHVILEDALQRDIAISDYFRPVELYRILDTAFQIPQVRQDFIILSSIAAGHAGLQRLVRRIRPARVTRTGSHVYSDRLRRVTRTGAAVGATTARRLSPRALTELIASLNELDGIDWSEHADFHRQHTAGPSVESHFFYGFPRDIDDILSTVR